MVLSPSPTVTVSVPVSAIESLVLIILSPSPPTIVSFVLLPLIVSSPAPPVNTFALPSTRPVDAVKMLSNVALPVITKPLSVEELASIITLFPVTAEVTALTSMVAFEARANAPVVIVTSPAPVTVKSVKAATVSKSVIAIDPSVAVDVEFSNAILSFSTPSRVKFPPSATVPLTAILTVSIVPGVVAPVTPSVRLLTSFITVTFPACAELILLKVRMPSFASKPVNVELVKSEISKASVPVLSADRISKLLYRAAPVVATLAAASTTILSAVPAPPSTAAVCKPVPEVIVSTPEPPVYA